MWKAWKKKKVLFGNSIIRAFIYDRLGKLLWNWKKIFRVTRIIVKEKYYKITSDKKKKERNEMLKKIKKKKEDLESLCLHDEKNIIGRYERVAAKAIGLVKISINDVYPIVI